MAHEHSHSDHDQAQPAAHTDDPDHDQLVAPQAHDDHSHAHDEHEHGDHGHDHNEAEHAHPSGVLGFLRELLPFGHGHSHGEANIDSALEGSERGIRALKVSLVGLGATAIFQVVIYLASGSVGLLADTLHNFGDALTALPLWLAFVVGKRPPNRRYTYGYGRAEDLAGVAIVGVILISALIAGWESIQKFRDPQPLRNIGWVIAAAIVGFIGNEAVAYYRITVGHEIGSAALVADGEHARVDGFTSLAVLIGALGVLAGFPLADPIVGLLITIAILFIVRDAALVMWRRLMDAIDPETVETIERTAAGVAGVQAVSDPRVRWLGHRLQAELHISVNEDLPTHASHQIAEEVRHAPLPRPTAPGSDRRTRRSVRPRRCRPPHPHRPPSPARPGELEQSAKRWSGGSGPEG